MLLLFALPSTLNVTEVTLTLSVAETSTLIVPETEAPLAGERRLTVGAMASGFPFAAILEIGIFSIKAPDCRKPDDTITGTLACSAGSSSTTPPLRVCRISVCSPANWDDFSFEQDAAKIVNKSNIGIA